MFPSVFFIVHFNFLVSLAPSLAIGGFLENIDFDREVLVFSVGKRSYSMKTQGFLTNSREILRTPFVFIGLPVLWAELITHNSENL